MRESVHTPHRNKLLRRHHQAVEPDSITERRVVLAHISEHQLVLACRQLMDSGAEIPGVEALRVEIHRPADRGAVKLGDIDSIVGGFGQIEGQVVEAASLENAWP